MIGGAIGGNNSWTTGEGTNHGYQASERTHDDFARWIVDALDYVAAGSGGTGPEGELTP